MPGSIFQGAMWYDTILPCSWNRYSGTTRSSVLKIRSEREVECIQEEASWVLEAVLSLGYDIFKMRVVILSNPAQLSGTM